MAWLDCRCDLVNHAQEFQPLLMPVPVVAHPDYGAIESAHGRKQGLPARSAATVDPMAALRRFGNRRTGFGIQAGHTRWWPVEARGLERASRASIADNQGLHLL